MPDRVSVPTWRDRPRVPAYGTPWVHVALPWPGRPVEVLLLGEALVGVWLHHLRPEVSPPKGRTVPCCLPNLACEHCACPQRPPRWVGYCAAWHARMARPCLACLSEHAVYSLPELCPEDMSSLRGLYLRLRRDGTAHNSPVVAEVLPWSGDLAKAPAAIDVREALLRIWGYQSATGLAWDDLRGLEVARLARQARAGKLAGQG